MNDTTKGMINQYIREIEERLQLIQKSIETDDMKMVTVKYISYNTAKDFLTVYYNETDITHRFYHFMKNPKVSKCFETMYITPYGINLDYLGDIESLDVLIGKVYNIYTSLSREGYLNIISVDAVIKTEI